MEQINNARKALEDPEVFEKFMLEHEREEEERVHMERIERMQRNELWKEIQKAHEHAAR